MPEEVVKLKKHETVGTDGGHGQDCSESRMASGCVCCVCQIQPPFQGQPMSCHLRYSLILVLAQGPVNSDMLPSPVQTLPLQTYPLPSPV